MEWKALILDGYDRVPQELEEILKGLKENDLNWQPNAKCNSIGWTVWHLGRVEDAQIADLAGKEQVYLKNKWYARFNRPPDLRDTGFGATPEEVAAFRSPSAEVLLGYAKDSTEESKRYISSLSTDELDRVLGGHWVPPPTVGVRIVSILADVHQHTGEASYIHGLRKTGK